METGARLLAAFIIAACGLSAILQPAPAQLSSPFGRNMGGAPMDPEDLALMKKAMRDALEQYKVGASTTWVSPKSGRAGRAVVTKTYEMNGMRCAQLTHQFTKGQGSTYTAPLCKAADGSWKLAF
jgi:surface antigen